MEELRINSDTAKAATSLMSQFMEAGLVQQTGDAEFTVHGRQGDQEFTVV